MQQYVVLIRRPQDDVIAIVEAETFTEARAMARERAKEEGGKVRDLFVNGGRFRLARVG